MMSSELQRAWEEYRRACYGTAPLTDIQRDEVRQAFLSGIHWMNMRNDPDGDVLEECQRLLKGRMAKS